MLLHAYLISFCMAVCLFVAFDGVSTRTDPFTSGKRYRKLVNNAVFIRNESLFVSAVATSAFQLEHTQRMPCRLWNTDYRIWENISHVGLWGILSSFSANFPPRYHTILTINCVHASNWFIHLQPTWQIDGQNDNSLCSLDLLQNIHTYF